MHKEESFFREKAFPIVVLRKRLEAIRSIVLNLGKWNHKYINFSTKII